MIYVTVRSVELQIERVRLRVSEGGHDVPVDKIIARRARSFSELAWHLDHVDECCMFDNSGDEPTLIGVQPGLYMPGRLSVDMREILERERVKPWILTHAR